MRFLIPWKDRGINTTEEEQVDEDVVEGTGGTAADVDGGNGNGIEDPVAVDNIPKAASHKPSSSTGKESIKKLDGKAFSFWDFPSLS